jgi:hypothetical protein
VATCQMGTAKSASVELSKLSGSVGCTTAYSEKCSLPRLCPEVGFCEVGDAINQRVDIGSGEIGSSSGLKLRVSA